MLANYIKSNDIYEEEAKPSTKDLKNKTVGRVFILFLFSTPTQRRHLSLRSIIYKNITH